MLPVRGVELHGRGHLLDFYAAQNKCPSLKPVYPKFYSSRSWSHYKFEYGGTKFYSRKTWDNPVEGEDLYFYQLGFSIDGTHCRVPHTSL